MTEEKTWWGQRTQLEKYLIWIAVLVILCAAVFSLTIALLLSKLDDRESGIELPTRRQTRELKTGNSHLINELSSINSNNCDHICLTPGCVQAAAAILSNLDDQKDPCDNFYAFACGRFLKRATIPDDASSVSAFSEMSGKTVQQLRIALEESPKEGEGSVITITRKFYNSCTNETKIEELGTKPILGALKNLGGWPLLEGDNWDESLFDWKDTIYKLKTEGFLYDRILDFHVGVDLKNTSLRTLSIDQGKLGIFINSMKKSFNDPIVQDYYNYQINIAVQLGADRDRAIEELRESTQFCIDLAKASKTKAERMNITTLYHTMTIEDMEKKFPTIPWLTYINRLMPISLQVTKDERIVVHAPEYISKLEKLLADTPKRVQANWLLWTAVSSSVGNLHEKIVKTKLQYPKLFSGIKTKSARWMDCVIATANSMQIGVASMYVKRFFDTKAKKSALEMILNIKAEFKKELENVEWMDELTRSEALKKLDSMETYVGYPDELLDDKKLDEFYKNVNISDEFFSNVLNLRKYYTERSSSRLREPVNKTDWLNRVNSVAVNAVYHPVGNSIDIPAGILQGIFFSQNRPHYLNYGSIGFVFGHEITHGFDNIGRQFDKEGNLHNWWGKETEERFLLKAKCVINQYGNYTVPEINKNLNGINTQGENIADNGGIKEAYRAYIEWTKRNGEEPALPGLTYTPRQLFWLSAATTWCFKYRPEGLKSSVDRDSHSPGMFRIIGALSNSPEFANDFKCPLGSMMNPVKKCVVW